MDPLPFTLQWEEQYRLPAFFLISWHQEFGFALVWIESTL
jgi:hypothetical protein